jgi:hypothetical protein
MPRFAMICGASYAMPRGTLSHCVVIHIQPIQPIISKPMLALHFSLARLLKYISYIQQKLLTHNAYYIMHDTFFIFS